MLETVKQTIAEYHMLTAEEPVLAALSGGADSVSLLLALLTLGYPVRAFHLNHCLRGQESDRDEAFCRRLCEARQVPLTVERVDVRAEAARRGESVETAARQIRYERLAAAAHGMKIATAHTADDNVETMLFHLARGTGAKGLAGIPPVRGGLIRPLISVSRREVEAYLAGIGQAYVTDSSNHSDCYTRNRIRHEIVPELQKINPELAAAAGRTARLLRQDDDCLAGLAEQVVSQAAGADGAYAVQRLQAAHPAVRSRALRLIAVRAGVPQRDFSMRHVAALEALIKSENPSAVCTLPGGFVARREYGAVRFVRNEMLADRPPFPLPVPFEGPLWNGEIKITVRPLEKNEVFYKSFNTFCVDCGTINLDTLQVRTRLAGDRIRLSGHSGSRTLKKLLIDRKIPRLRRGRLAVIADRNGVIAVQDIGMDISRAPQGGALMEIKVEG
ncbi:MAG: tRNA lysidine(34) synthetase TilS [Eubacteriales bacterium]|nr:tRNA lysidine(34) synthetase TilS [Eubacteriales bacterium]